MSAELQGLNAGYVAQLLEDYLESPASVAPEWRELFERDEAVLDTLPGLRRLLEVHGNGDGDGSGNGHEVAAVPPPVDPGEETVAASPPVPAGPEPAAASAVDETLLGGVAAAMALVKAYRMHGHLAARLDPARLGADGRPRARRDAPRAAADAGAPGEDSGAAAPPLRSRRDARSRRCRGCARSTAGSIAYEIEHISDHAERVWLRQAIEIRPLPAARSRRTSAAPCSSASRRSRRFEQYLRRVVPRPEAVLARRARRPHPDARRGDRARGRRTVRTRS